MAWKDPYADVDEYKARAGIASTGQDAEITAQLTSVSRLIERELGEDPEHPRVFNESSAASLRYFDGAGGTRLRVDDLVLVSTDGIEVDENLDASFGTDFDPTNEGWCVLRPYNADDVDQAFNEIELLPLSSNDTLTAWPIARHNVRITATWGWPAVPEPVRELTVLLTRQLRDIQESGVTYAIAALESQIQMTPGAFPMMQELKRRYSRRLPGIA